jgi:hypothetical protein
MLDTYRVDDARRSPDSSQATTSGRMRRATIATQPMQFVATTETACATFAPRTTPRPLTPLDRLDICLKKHAGSLMIQVGEGFTCM